MNYSPPITIREAIEKIDTNQYLLPAIQREFVWSSDKIERLFDSLMRDYPIGLFLMWRVNAETKVDLKFYTILKSYREFYNTHCKELYSLPSFEFDAILDGQQRLTAMYIGLKGSYAYKLRSKHWVDNEESLPTRRLYLSLDENTIDPDDNEDQRLYDFKFLTEKESQEGAWFEVGKILHVKENYDFNKLLRENEWDSNDYISKALSKLHAIIHTNNNIYYYVEKDQDYDKALNIFLRVNSGGEKLTPSDLIMSKIMSNWPKARSEFSNLIDEIWDTCDIRIEEDLIIRSYLMGSSLTKDTKFNVMNFTTNNTKEFEDNWGALREAIAETFLTIRSYGYDQKRLTSLNAVLPIIYWVYTSDRTNQYSTKIAYKDERILIKKWLHIVLLKKIFGGQSDNIIKIMRDTIKDEYSLGAVIFPFDAISKRLAGTNKSLAVDDDFLETLLYTQYGDRYAFSVLSLLYPYLDYKNGDFHLDHIFPKSLFTDVNLRKQGIDSTNGNSKYYKDKNIWNGIVNLQLLDGNDNKSKNDKTFKEWIESENVNFEKQILPRQYTEFSEFPGFVEERWKMLKEKLNKIFNGYGE